MKITIDTKEDSHHDIKRLIGMLQKLVGETQQSSSLFEGNSESPAPSSEGASSFVNMFGDNSPPADSNESSSLSESEPLSEEPEETSDDTPPEIIPY